VHLQVKPTQLFMKGIFFITVIILLVITAGSAAWYAGKLHHAGKVSVDNAGTGNADKALRKKLSSVAVTAKQYAAAHQFSTQFCCMVDMSIASGKPRFFVFDFKKDSVLMEGLVTHGRCNQDWLSGRKYGNTIGCGCTSLGKYRIGNAYRGRFGLAYKLNGMDTTNSNAYSRFVVLHAHQCVPEKPVDPGPICQSDGCPTVSPGFLQQLAVLIDRNEKPVLLWIFE
jgi:L,D-transpeptidase catalytic domain